jgi:antitoxin component YwqK of YwqJK toxin-antitoxin module
MKIFQTLLLLLSLIGHAAQAQGFFYFGNSNLVGTGKMEGTSKEGVWKIYARKEAVDNPMPAILQLEEVEVKKNFNLEVPLYKLEFKANQLDGVFEEFYGEGSVKKVVNYQKGLLHGDFFEFGKEGELLFSGTYFQGEKTGDWYVYQTDGSIKSEYSYQNNLLVGQSIVYYPDGQVAERIPFEMGKVSGTYESFFPNGTPKERVAFVGGEEQGEFIQFHGDGTLAISANFSKGILNGPWQSYDEQGVLLAQGMYQQGVQGGEWKEIYPEVAGFFWVGRYEKDKKEGIWEVQSSTGFVHQEETFQSGSLVEISEFTTESGLVLDAGRLEKGDGKRYFFDAAGNRLQKGRYANGQRTGIWYTYFPSTNLVASSGSYFANQKRGTWKYYDINSQLISEEIIPAGRETESTDRSGSTSTPQQGRTRSYMPQQNSNGVVVPQFRVLTPDGGMAITGPKMFQLGN